MQIRSRKEPVGRAIFAAALALLVAVSLQGCVKGMDISDEELVQKMSECFNDDNKTPGMAVACGNYQKECKRRGKATGNYIC